MKNEIIPLRAIVILRQGQENTIVPQRFTYKAARVLEQLTVNPWNANMLQAAKEFSMCLCREVPVICLSCRPDIGAVEVLEQELERLV